MIKKKVIDLFIPNIFIIILEKIRNFLILNFFKVNPIILKNKTLRSKKKNKRAFLIATGPSLKNVNLKLLKNQDCFTLSNAFLLNDINVIKPILHFFAPHHKPITIKSFFNWLKESDKKLPRSTSIVMSYDDTSFIKKKLFKGRDIYYLLYSKYLTKFHSNIIKPLPKFQTGSLIILPVLLSMGYKEIYLLGCDHNQLKNYKDTISNFYSEKNDVRITSKKTKLNEHFLNLERELYANIEVHKQYKKFKLIAETKKVKIINLSANSWLNIFPKKKLKEII